MLKIAWDSLLTRVAKCFQIRMSTDFAAIICKLSLGKKQYEKGRMQIYYPVYLVLIQSRLSLVI